MSNFGYKKYMKKDARQESPLLKIFIISFVGMLLFFTFIMKSFLPSVDTTIGDYSQSNYNDSAEEPKIVDDRLSMIQNEDQEKNFSSLMNNAADIQHETVKPQEIGSDEQVQMQHEAPQPALKEPIYKVFVGNYTSAEQAKVAKEIIQEAGNQLNPIIKCIGNNNYTLQVGIFKNKQSAEALLYTVQQSNLPGRIVQDY